VKWIIPWSDQHFIVLLYH